MHRAHAVLTIKAVTEDANFYHVEGIASTPTPDRMGDVVEPMGAKFTLPMPLLWQHDAGRPVGEVVDVKTSRNGITFKGRIPKIKEAGTLRDRIEEAVQSIKYGLVKGTSIGFRDVADKVERLKSGGLRYLEWLWIEHSLVTIPANVEANVTNIKSIDTDVLAALGQRMPGAPALGRTSSNITTTPRKGNTMNNYTQEMLSALRETRTTHEKRMEELIGAKGEGGFTDEQRAEFNDSRSKIADLDDEIAVCEVHVNNIRTARPVEQRSGAPYGFARKFTDVEPKFKGEEGVKKFVAETVATIDAKRGIYQASWQVAEKMFGKTNPTLVAIMKADVAGGGSGTGEWGAELVQADTRYTGDFIEYLYAMTVFDKLPLRSVPHNVAIKGQDGANIGYWVGESKAIPMSKADFSTVSTAPLKVAALTVMSNELIRDSSPAALGIVGDSLREALAQIVDTTFFSATAAVANQAPAGIVNGVAAIASNGGSAADIIADLVDLMAPFQTAKNTAGQFAMVMTPAVAFALSMARNALGQQDAMFAGINQSGGTLNGVPVYVGDNIGTGDVYLLKCSDIYKIGDLGVTLSVSNEAMIEQSDAPTGATDTPVAASTKFTSMFQEESTAIKVVRPINWSKRRTPAVSWLDNSAWGSS